MSQNQEFYCHGCGDAQSSEEELATCVTSLFEPGELGAHRPCVDYDFYCASCRNKHDFCRRCAAAFSEARQVEILEKYDAG